MHHWESPPKNMHAGKPTAFKNAAAALALKESQPQQHRHTGTELERMRDKLFG
jgi:hypothetical protein